MTSEFNFLTDKFIVAHAKATGIRAIPQIFPWKWLGCTDEEFMSAEMKYSHGQVIPDKHKQTLGVVRQQETELRTRRDYVKKRETVMGSFPKQVQLELW